MEAIKAAAREILDQCCADLRVTLNGLDEAALTREPAPETSSIGTLIRHTASATHFLLTCAATGRGERTQYRAVVRPAAFGNEPSPSGALIGIVDAMEEDCRKLIAAIPIDRLDERVAMDDAAPGESQTRAYSLFHAIEHLREHVGHAQLTRQVLTS
ncbi:MAG: DinB family protein [Dehalococcoidia bacterium]